MYTRQSDSQSDKPTAVFMNSLFMIYKTFINYFLLLIKSVAIYKPFLMYAICTGYDGDV